MNSYTILFQPLTPLWTGNAERQALFPRETGIAGSLRWWYSVILRYFGMSACDVNDVTRSNCKEKKHCDCCEMFGCTGWSRKFKLVLRGDGESLKSSNFYIESKKLRTRDKRPFQRPIGGYISKNTLNLTIIPLKSISEVEWKILNLTFYIIEKYGAIGAKTSQGNGIISVKKSDLPYKDELISDTRHINDDINEYSLDNFFSCKFDLEFTTDIQQLISKKVFWVSNLNSFTNRNYNWIQWSKCWVEYNFLPIAFQIRDSIRCIIKDQKTRHETFGSRSSSQGQGSKVHVSHGYNPSGEEKNRNVEIRLWGYGIKPPDVKSITETIQRKDQLRLFSQDNDFLKSCKMTDIKFGKELMDGYK